MPAKQRGKPYRLGRGSWGLRYYDRAARAAGAAASRVGTEALDWFERWRGRGSSG